VSWTGPLVGLFDGLDRSWHGARARKVVAWMLVGTFALTLAAIELDRRGLLRLPGQHHNHFFAVQVAFYLLLAYEVVGLVLAIAQSVANAAGKQFEIYSLILLRHAFEEFGHLEEPVRWEQARDLVLRMIADATGALLVFVLLGFYYAAQRHLPLSGDVGDRDSFIRAKKVIALALLAVFAALGARSVWSIASGRGVPSFFEAFYTLLIFADLLIVLLSMRYSSSYHVVFRNSGLAVSTVLLRMGLSAPPFFNALLGVLATLFAHRTTRGMAA